MDLHDLAAKVQSHRGADTGPVFIFNRPKWNKQGFNIASREVGAGDIYREAGACLRSMERNLQRRVAGRHG